ncbi:MAG: transposase [Rhodothermaceae bacterium]|nr:transposase [Rhodothermaceae bacterium]MYF64320.1 transposase [Rhodothermaceae bacterium]MYI85042.1 transposase [Rhodothermaceae bacterium]
MSSSFHVMKGTELPAYKARKRAAHATFKYLVKDNVNGMEHIRGMGSCWPLLKRRYYGTNNKMLPKHLQRYVDEFVG